MEGESTKLRISILTVQPTPPRSTFFFSVVLRRLDQDLTKAGVGTLQTTINCLKLRNGWMLYERSGLIGSTSSNVITLK